MSHHHGTMVKVKMQAILETYVEDTDKVTEESETQK